MRLILTLFFSFFALPAYSEIMPGIWDGKCLTVTNEHQHRNPDNDNPGGRSDAEKMKGFIPPAIGEYTGDITTCFPPAYGMGSK